MSYILPSQSVISVANFQLLLTQAHNNNIESPKILYTTMHSGPAIKPDIVTSFPPRFIPQSIDFDFQKQFADKQSKLSNTMANAQQFATQADLLGIKNTDTLVIYDDFGNFCASRVWFMFKTMGHKHVYVLDGGLPAYLRADLPTVESLQVPRPNTQACYQTISDTAFNFVDKHYVLNNLDTKAAVLADARNNLRFSGASPEEKPNLRAGHIPESINIHYASLQDEYGHFLSTHELKKIFASYGTESMLFSCGSGVTACILAQAAHMVGIQQVNVYDGSWSQWGADTSLPISTDAQ